MHARALPLPQIFPELQGIFGLLENEFNPLALVTAVKPILDFIRGHDELKQYVLPLEKLLVLRSVSFRVVTCRDVPCRVVTFRAVSCR
jgi:hypothetical protein